MTFWRDCATRRHSSQWIGFNLSLKTDATGHADLSLRVADSGVYRFKVRTVTHPIREYDASLNIETRDTLVIP